MKLYLLVFKNNKQAEIKIINKNSHKIANEEIP